MSLTSAPAAPAPLPRTAPEQIDTDQLIQGLTPDQLAVLADKVFELWRDELRLENERYGRNSFR